MGSELTVGVDTPAGAAVGVGEGACVIVDVFVGMWVNNSETAWVSLE